jgi:hypothetical protein
MNKQLLQQALAIENAAGLLTQATGNAAALLADPVIAPVAKQALADATAALAALTAALNPTPAS